MDRGGDVVFSVIEYPEGTVLHNFLARQILPLDAGVVTRMISAIGKDLKTAHGRDLIHEYGNPDTVFLYVQRPVEVV